MRSLTCLLILVLAAGLWPQARDTGLATAGAKGDDKELADIERASNQLHNIGIAMHNRAFPPAVVVNRQGRALLSWRVLLLPYLDEAKLFTEFKLDEAWDSPHNNKLLPKRPKVYAPVRNHAGADTTYFQVFHGPGAAFQGHRPLGVGTFSDGSSNTILVVEAADAVPWTKPADLSYDPKKPLPKVGAMFKNVFLACMADGSVRRIKKTIKEKTLRAAITRSGGEAITLDD